MALDVHCVVVDVSSAAVFFVCFGVVMFVEQIGRQFVKTMGAMGLACFSMLLFGLYLQHAIGLEPCPMCIVQRYLLLFVGVFCTLAALSAQNLGGTIFASLALVSSVAGGFVAARQSWLQWYPPEVVSCGRDLYGMIERFPLQRVLPMVFKGSGDCAKVDWTFLGGSIANWSFVWFVIFAVLCGLAIATKKRLKT